MTRSRRVPRLMAACICYVLLPAGAVGPAWATAEAAAREGAASPSDPILDPAAREWIERLLEEAQAAWAGRRLTSPPHDNALDRYRQVLVFLPEDPRALTGLAQITESLFAEALGAAERQDRGEAERLLQVANSVLPDHRGASRVAARVEHLLQGARERIPLDATALEARSGELGARLATVGARAKEEDLLVVITAPRDDLGRWIYQQMNAAPPNRRLRAQSEIGQPPRLELRDDFRDVE